MKIIGIGSDRTLFQEGSEAAGRQLFYSTVTDEMYIVVFSLKRHGLREKKLSEKIFLYPTNSLSRWLYIFDAYRIAKRIVVSCQLSVVSCRDYVISTQDPFEAGLVGYFLKRKFNLPLQLQIHTDFLNPYFIRESLLNRIRVLLAKFLLPRANCIRVVSERIRNSLKSKILNLKSEIFVLPAFVDFQKLIDAPVKTDLRKKYSERFIILMASRLTREKNIVSVIEAMREVVKQFPKALLLIVGEGPERKALELQATSYNLQPNIVFEPWTDDLASYYKTSDLFLVSSFYEGYGRTILEALSCGLPVASTKVGIAEEAIQDGGNGFLISLPDSRSIADVLQKALGAQSNAFQTRKSAHESAMRFILPPDEYLGRLRETLL
ncbi:MAG: glycosyltransferase [bacterium]|nr:glycosyltransferase [bacterium]